MEKGDGGRRGCRRVMDVEEGGGGWRWKRRVEEVEKVKKRVEEEGR